MSKIIGFIGAETTREMQAGDCELAVGSHEGDTKTIWNPNNTDEVENARRTYNDLRAKNYLAFKVDAKGDKGEQMTEFDPTAGKVIMMPQFQGG